MMGSPQMALKLPLLLAGTCIMGTFLSTETGRKLWVKFKHGGQHEPGKTGFGYSTTKADVRAHHEEMDDLRKVNVQPIWEENTPVNK